MLENDINDVIDTTFSVEHDSFGCLQGARAEEEREEPGDREQQEGVCQALVNYRFMHGIEQQFGAAEGIQRPHPAAPPQVRRAGAGTDDRGLEKIDLEDWKTNTRLKQPGQILSRLFGSGGFVEAYSEEMRARLLQFVTGSSRVPTRLRLHKGSTGCRPATVHPRRRRPLTLPKAHTCFNRLDTRRELEKMNGKVTQAVEETCGSRSSKSTIARLTRGVLPQLKLDTRVANLW